MRQFANSNFLLTRASKDTKLIYTGFLLLVAIGLLTILAFQIARIGISYERLVVHYRGGELGQEIAFPKTFAELLEVTHFHAFMMAIIFLALAHLFIATSLRPSLKFFITSVAFLGTVIDLIAPWLIRYVSPLFALLQLLSWIGMWMGYLPMILFPLYDMWLKKPRPTAKTNEGTD